MATLTFYFDPVCPWAWRTFLWIREVQKLIPLTVQWRVFSLREINRDDDPLAAEHAQSDDVLRLLVLARRIGGDEAIGRLYLSLGKARHERREKLKDPAVVEAALEEAGLDRALLARALDDPSTDLEVLAEHREAVDRLGAFGVPWLILGDNQFGFYGPIIAEVPSGDAALALWEHSSWFLAQPDFYEFKRSRDR